MVDVFHPSASVIASWPQPNYVNPQTHGPGLTVICILLSSLGLIIVCTRLYARAFITRALGIDDALIVLATVFAVGLAVLNIIGSVLYYSDRHIWDIPVHILVPHRINIWVSEICITLALSLTKISILLFYRRISASFSKTFFIAVWVGIVYNILYMISFILAICLLCRPLSAFWLEFNPLWAIEHPNRCGHERVMEPLISIFSSIGDAYATILPMVLITRLDMPWAQKRALYCLFGLGFLVVITGIIRLVYLYRMVLVTYDFTWTLWEMWILTEVEMWMAIFVASAPALKPVVKMLAAYLGYHFSEVSHRVKGLYSSSSRYAHGTRNNTTRGSAEEVGDGTESTAAFEMGRPIKIKNGEVRYTVKSRYSNPGSYNAGSTRQSVLSADDARSHALNAHPWRMDASWSRVESPEPSP